MTVQEALMHPFSIGAMVGLSVGMLFFALALVLRWSKSAEFKRFQTMVNDKMKFEAEHQELARAERLRLADENKNLKLKISEQEKTPSGSLAKDMEIMARAERRLMLSAPTFTSAWEDAKTEAMAELEAEAAGQAKPKSGLRRLFASSSNGQVHAGSTA